jgi:hypothetical protein
MTRAALLAALLSALPAFAQAQVESLQVLLFDPRSGELAPLESGGNVVGRQVLVIVKVKGQLPPTGQQAQVRLEASEKKGKPRFDLKAPLDTGLTEQAAMFYLAPFSACSTVTFKVSLLAAGKTASKTYELPFACYE